MKLAAVVFVCCTEAGAADLERGAAVLRESRCLECHNFREEGRGEPVERYTPAALASAMWNHTPLAWSAIGSAPWKASDA